MSILRGTLRILDLMNILKETQNTFEEMNNAAFLKRQIILQQLEMYYSVCVMLHLFIKQY